MSYERTRVEEPAIRLLESLGWRYVTAADLPRDSKRSVYLNTVLEKKLLEFNPWLLPEHLAYVIRRLTLPNATGLLESNEEVHTMLTRGISVQGDFDGLPSKTVKFIDFDNVTQNDFIVTNQLRVWRSSVEDTSDPKRVVFDIALFVNGVLFGIIECKDFVQGVEVSLAEGMRQLERYQELGDFRGDGAPRAFSSVQALAVICREAAVYAAVGAPTRYFAPFPESYPRSLEWLGTAMGLPTGQQTTAQDVLLYSVFTPENLLEFSELYSVFEIEEKRKVRKLARHQQRIAVDRSIRRVLGAEDPFSAQTHALAVKNSSWKLEPTDRGGVIWHTQGSGKSLTMVWLAAKLRQARVGLQNPVLIVVTDRVDLDKQINGVFKEAGFALPTRAKNVKELKELLRARAGATIMTTVQKFQDALSKGLLNPSSNIFALVDEAHRTQYGLLATSMRAALPNAVFIAFTGTPIDKRDRSTIDKFGAYIHRYTMLEAVRDGATVPIYYEGRDLETFSVTRFSIDEVFERWFSDYAPEKREEIKAHFATIEAVAGAPARVRAVALDIVKHFEEFIAPNGFKGQIVVASRDIAVKYKEALDEFGAPPSEVVFTVSNGDEQRFKDFARTDGELEDLLDKFKKDPDDPVRLLIVVDMLLTGFDAPLEQVMYLDKPLREHALLQAIARVNRVALGKDRGFVVDYWGVTDDLRDALSIFDANDLQEVMRPVSQILRELEPQHVAVMRVFGGKQIPNTAALLMLGDPLRRQEFETAFKRMARSLNALMPSKEAAPFLNDFKWLSRVRAEARTTIDRTDQSDWSGIAPKIRKLIDESIQADGVYQVIAPIDILSPQFDTAVQNLQSPEAQALEMAHAAEAEITVKFPQNPVFYATLRERLEQIIRARRDGRMDAVAQVGALRELIDRLRNAPTNRAAQLGLSQDAEALFNLLEASAVTDKDIARQLESTLKNLVVVDWLQKEDVMREMRRQLRRELRNAGVTKEALEPVVNQMMDLARSRLAQ